VPQVGGAVIATVNVGIQPEGMAFDPANGYVYVANHGSGTVSIISGTMNVGSVTISPSYSGPYDLAYDSKNQYLYLTNDGSYTVSVIEPSLDTGTQVETVTDVGQSPAGIAYDSFTGYLYVANALSDTISVISGSSNAAFVNLSVGGASPSGVAFDSSNGYVYVTGYDGVAVVDGNTELPTNTLVKFLFQAYGSYAAFDPSNGYIYVSYMGSQFGGSVWVIDGSTNTVLSSIHISPGPIAGLAYDSANGYMYVADPVAGYSIRSAERPWSSTRASGPIHSTWSLTRTTGTFTLQIMIPVQSQ